VKYPEAVNVMTNVYGIKPVYKFCGGGIPIVTMFHDILHMENVMVPLGNEDCQMHAINENFRKTYVKKALQFSKEFLKK
jgi:acetylornithine deacetylase/succinyl-diaminopimelate desuccinylase-like protein